MEVEFRVASLFCRLRAPDMQDWIFKTLAQLRSQDGGQDGGEDGSSRQGLG